MNFLINASNLKMGGAIQVADSICQLLKEHQEHHFVVVLSTPLWSINYKICEYANLKVVKYDLRQNWRTLLLGRESFLDKLVKDYNIDAVLTIFGPTGWDPKCPHLVGFARAQLLMLDSPYYKIIKFSARIKEYISNFILGHYFTRSNSYLYTENPEVTELFKKKFNYKKIYSVTNYYNQIYDNEDKWVSKILPPFNGCTILSISGVCAHKNLGIAIDIAKILKEEHHDFNFRFVFTFNKDVYYPIPDELKDCFVFVGRVRIEECPSLYKQADIMFQPSLMECFTATYPEAMRMQCPIVTTDLDFARGLCGEAAHYYSPLSAKDAANAIYNVAKNGKYQKELIEAGKKQLKKYDNYEQRVRKLVNILERISTKN